MLLVILLLCLFAILVGGASFVVGRLFPTEQAAYRVGMSMFGPRNPHP